MKQHNKVKRLQARIKAYEEMMTHSTHPGEYKKPGSFKRS